MRKIVILLVVVILISGCVTPASRTNRLSLGMTKSEVIAAMGNPISTKAKAEEGEWLEYWLDVGGWESQRYWVILKDNKVVQYGNAGDFGTVLPEDRREYDIKIQNK